MSGDPVVEFRVHLSAGPLDRLRTAREQAASSRPRECPELCARIAELPNVVAIKWSVPREICTRQSGMAADRRMREYTDLAFAGDNQKARAVRDSLDQVRKVLKETRPGGKPQAHQKYW